MNKSMLYSGLLSILSTTVCADVSNLAAGTLPENAVQIAVNATHQQAIIPEENPTTLQIAAASSTQAVAPVTTTTQTVVPVTTTTQTVAPATTSPTVVPATTQPIDCNYRIPAETARVEQSLVTQWAEKATQQSFDFDHGTMDQQLTTLKACYTEQGWQSFNDALQKSGNMHAIQTQKLMVNGLVDGKSIITEIKENQWKLTIPLQVVYQNEKEKLTQLLSVDLIVGRKTSGDLGIMQIIASPRVAAHPAAKVTNTTTTTTTTTAPTP
ncbi:MAG: DotI/IcmL family type IV secretion protein [Legionella sp.]|nr:DotI/IcmL family type IV secretion protein [Legionella sp.]